MLILDVQVKQWFRSKFTVILNTKLGLKKVTEVQMLK